LEDPLIQVLGIFQGLNAQFALEEILIGAVLAEGLGPLPGLPVEAHEKTMDVLLKRIEDEKTLTCGYRLVPFPPGNETLDETGQSTEEQQEKSFPFKGEPLLKVGCAGNGESGQKVPLVEVESPTDPADALRSGGKTGLRVLEARLEDLFEIANVRPEGSSGRDVDPGALNGQTGFGGRAGLVKRAAEVP